MNRRRSLQAAMAFAAPMILPSRLFGDDAPGRKITLGCIGVGTHGTGVNLKTFLAQPDARVLAVCDVFTSRRDNALAMVNKTYGNQDCRAVADFREILADKSIDAVVISTPDHWHVPMSLMALAAGKDVFCEKPTLTIDQGRELVQAVAKHKAVFQTGLEDRSLARYHRVAELVRNGVIGTLRAIKVGLPSGKLFAKEAAVAPPADLDYNLWLGPAPFQPYSPNRVSTNGWRMIRDYSGGTLTDWGAHLVDTAMVGNGSEKSGPVEVEGTGTVPPDALNDVPMDFKLRYRFANGVTMDVAGGGVLIRFEGDKGYLGIGGWDGNYEASDLALFRTKIPAESNTFRQRPAGEHRNFLDCVRTRAATTYPAEDLHRLSTALHLGALSIQLGRKLHWNPETESFANDPAADALRSRPARQWQTA